MNVVLIGSRYFGTAALDALQKENVTITRVVVPAADDRLAAAAAAAGLDSVVQPDPRIVAADAIPAGTDLIVTAHSHARVSNEALARSRLGGGSVTRTLATISRIACPGLWTRGNVSAYMSKTSA